MRYKDGFYNKPDPDIDYLDNKDVIDVEQAYELMFQINKEKVEWSCFGSLYEEGKNCI